MRQKNLTRTFQQQRLVSKTKFVVRSNPNREKLELFSLNNIGFISRCPKLSNIEIEKIDDHTLLKHIYIFKENDSNRLILKSDLASTNYGELSGYLGRFVQTTYKSTTNGEFFPLNFLSAVVGANSFFPFLAEIVKGGLGIWIPQEIISSLVPSVVKTIKEGSFIKKDQQLSRNETSPTNGVVKPYGSNKKVSQLVLQPGIHYKFPKSSVLVKNFRKNLKREIFFSRRGYFRKICCKTNFIL